MNPPRGEETTREITQARMEKKERMSSGKRKQTKSNVIITIKSNKVKNIKAIYKKGKSRNSAARIRSRYRFSCEVTAREYREKERIRRKEYVAKMIAEGTYRAFLDRRNARRKEKRKANSESETFICQWILEITLACITFLQFALYMFVIVSEVWS